MNVFFGHHVFEMKVVTAWGLWMFSEDYVKNKGDVLDFSFTSVLDMPL